MDGIWKNDVLFDSITPFLLFELHFSYFVIRLIWSGTDLWVQMTARRAKLPAQGVIHPLVLLAH